MIEYLSNICYSMSTAYELLKPITNDYFKGIGGYKNIKIQGQEFEKYNKIQNLNIRNCLDEFSTDYGTAKDIAENYEQIAKSNPSYQCGCAEIFGLYRFYLEK